MAQQDDYFYEIQLSNKQLVFYFMAGATVLILSFLAGVMVGPRRGREHGRAGRAQHHRSHRREGRSSRSRRGRRRRAAEDLTYAQRLESDKGDEGLEKPVAPRPPRRSSPRYRRPAAPPSPRRRRTLAREIAAGRAQPRRGGDGPADARPPGGGADTGSASDGRRGRAGAKGQFTIQVGAFKDRASADTVSGRLKGKGFAAYVLAPASPDGLSTCAWAPTPPGPTPSACRRACATRRSSSRSS